MKLLLSFVWILMLSGSLHAQIPEPWLLPKREFRAAWVATVSNIDWPSKPGLPVETQKAEAIQQLDRLRSMGCNAVIFQVRPAADAFYQSAYEPWSRFLTGKQGRAPVPYYDPLQFWIEEAHKRHMELHAWFNPFRALTDSKKNPNPETHVTRTQPQWVIHYGGKSYLDPGIPDARAYTLRVIADCARRYDIDAVHIDDYFYPYKVAGQEFGDGGSYARYNAGNLGRADWRRANVNAFIQAMHDSVRAIKPWVKVGISPFGVWRSRAKDSLRGSDTRPTTTTNYDDLYADVLLWQEKGWADYLLPQLYWEHGHRSAPFEVLLPWWNQWKYSRHVYYGLGVYRMTEPNGPATWRSPAEILAQIRAIRKLKTPSGFAFYSAVSFSKIPHALTDSLVQLYTPTIALPPAMPWLGKTAPATPAGLRITADSGTATLQWQPIPAAGREPVRYAVYRFAANEPINIERSERLIALTHTPSYVDAFRPRTGQVVYVVTALDRLWNESAPSAVVRRP
jgi:uncharacterized lipoprotein YddW (UPF0748 family)